MIGRLRFNWAETSVVATLADNLMWVCADSDGFPVETASAFLDVVYGMSDEDYSPAAGAIGHRAFHAAVAGLHGTVVIPPTIAPSHPGEVF